MASRKVPININQYIAQLNLEDSKEHHALANSGVSKKDVHKALKKTAGYKEWAKTQRKSGSNVYPTSNFDADGNRIFKGDKTQAVFDTYDAKGERKSRGRRPPVSQ